MGNLVPNQGSSRGERDPKVIWDSETKKWYMYLTAGVSAVFESSDLKNWTRCGKVEGIGGECPDLFQLPVLDKEGNPSSSKTSGVAKAMPGQAVATRWVMSSGGAKYGVGHLEKGVWVLDQGERTHGFDAARPRGSMGYAWQTFGNARRGVWSKLALFRMGVITKKRLGHIKTCPLCSR